MDESTHDAASSLGDLQEELPDGVDQAAIRRMQKVARILDEGIRVPGTDFRFGIDPIVGILPGAGDTVASGVSLYIVLESYRLGVSRSALFRMLANIVVDTVGGSVPVLGVLFDAFWKANKWNVELALEDLAAGDTFGDDEPTRIEIE